MCIVWFTPLWDALIPLFWPKKKRHFSKSNKCCVACYLLCQPTSTSHWRMAGIVNTESQPQKPRVILAATGSVASVKFEILCRSFCEWAEVKAVVTKSSLHFIKKSSLPNEVVVLTDEDEWSSWNKLGDGVLHIELRKWADLIVIAPLSANTLAKVSFYLLISLF